MPTNVYFVAPVTTEGRNVVAVEDEVAEALRNWINGGQPPGNIFGLHVLQGRPLSIVRGSIIALERVS